MRHLVAGATRPVLNELPGPPREFRNRFRIHLSLTFRVSINANSEELNLALS